MCACFHSITIEIGPVPPKRKETLAGRVQVVTVPREVLEPVKLGNCHRSHRSPSFYPVPSEKSPFSEPPTCSFG